MCTFNLTIDKWFDPTVRLLSDLDFNTLKKGGLFPSLTFAFLPPKPQLQQQKIKASTTASTASQLPYVEPPSASKSTHEEHPPCPTPSPLLISPDRFLLQILDSRRTTSSAPPHHLAKPPLQRRRTTSVSELKLLPKTHFHRPINWSSKFGISISQ